MELFNSLCILTSFFEIKYKDCSKLLSIFHPSFLIMSESQLQPRQPHKQVENVLTSFHSLVHTLTHRGKGTRIHISRPLSPCAWTKTYNAHIHTHLVVSVGVGYSWVVVGGDTAVCNQWQGSGECKGWVLDCSAGPYIGYWTQAAAPQTDWTRQDREGEGKQANRRNLHDKHWNK